MNNPVTVRRPGCFCNRAGIFVSGDFDDERSIIHSPKGASFGFMAAIVMDRLTAFGLFAVTMMLVCYALEARSRWYVLGFAVACVLGSAYGFLQGAWPFGAVEAIWSLVAVRRWWQIKPPMTSETK